MDYQYYPTPAEVGERLAKMIHAAQMPILEPSAGTGDLIQAFINAHKHGRWKPLYSAKDFHCVELDETRAAALKGKDFAVVWSDFLTFNPLMPYRTIIMNPPFKDGAKHLLKAINILGDGGEIACILNAETIRNPYSNERKALIRQLEEQEDYQVEFVQSAFEDTDVEVALIHIKKKTANVKCTTFENFKKSVVEEREEHDPHALARYGEIDALIDNYRAEVKAALRLFDEIRAFNQLSPGNEVFELKNHFQTHADLVKTVNGIYWSKLLFSEELSRLLTHEVRNAYTAKLHEMCEYEFNERNILQLKADLVSNLFENIDAAIMKIWTNFTSRFHWNAEYSKNIHYYNGWRTNNAFRCNKKIIIPLYAFGTWSKELELYHVREELADIEKVMNYLDCGRTEDSDMADKLNVAQARGKNREIDTKFFTVDVFKKGTCHLKFKDMELLKKFNLYCGKRLNWLPDDYGRKPYESLDDEERAVADSFEGRDSYNETYHNQQFYLPSGNLLMLTADEVQSRAGLSERPTR